MKMKTLADFQICISVPLNSLGFYLSPECLLNFLWIIYSLCMGNVFQFMVFTLENVLNLCIFSHAPVPHSKLQVQIFEFSPSANNKGWGKLWFALSKFNQKIWRWLGTLVYLYFVWFIFFLNVIALLFCELFLSNSVVLSLLLLLCNHGNFTVKLN